MVPLISYGTIHDYIKSIQQQAKIKIKEQERSQQSASSQGSPLFTEQSAMLNATFTEAQSQADAVRMSTIDMGLRCGRKLSFGELEYLKKNNPDLYAKAVRIAKEREDYEKNLRYCKTKKDVLSVRMNKIASFMMELGAASERGDYAAVEEIGLRAMSINEEHTAFVNSKRYQQLPRDEKEYAERKKKRELNRKNERNTLVLMTREVPVRNEWLEKAAKGKAYTPNSGNEKQAKTQELVSAGNGKQTKAQGLGSAANQ